LDRGPQKAWFGIPLLLLGASATGAAAMAQAAGSLLDFANRASTLGCVMTISEVSWVLREIPASRVT